MARNLAIFFDGTWNTPDEDGDHEGDTSTNVHKLYEAVRAKTTQNRKQLKWYDEGVGTRWWNKLAGGAFGCGLSKNILQGYEWLMDEYEPGDELYIFGFSRGAYTARSLVGLIRNCGVLDRTRTSKSAKKRRLEEAFQLYKAKDEGPDSPVALKFREEYSLETGVACLGVWDTVGALGIPLQSFDWFNRRFYEFHDTELSSIVRHGYHALAIDEHRESYVSWNS